MFVYAGLCAVPLLITLCDRQVLPSSWSSLWSNQEELIEHWIPWDRCQDAVVHHCLLCTLWLFSHFTLSPSCCPSFRKPLLSSYVIWDSILWISSAHLLTPPVNLMSSHSHTPNENLPACQHSYIAPTSPSSPDKEHKTHHQELQLRNRKILGSALLPASVMSIPFIHSDHFIFLWIEFPLTLP